MLYSNNNNKVIHMYQFRNILGSGSRVQYSRGVYRYIYLVEYRQTVRYLEIFDSNIPNLQYIGIPI